jgi:hypothetical protein
VEVVAEVVFNLAFRAVSKSPTVYFAVAPFAVFAPLFLLWARNRYAGLTARTTLYLYLAEGIDGLFPCVCAHLARS